METHPRFPDIIYPLDYGRLEGTLSTDGAEIDLFIDCSEAEGEQARRFCAEAVGIGGQSR